MPSRYRSPEATPSQGRVQHTLSLTTRSSKVDTEVDLIGRGETGIVLWEHFSFPPGPEYPLWPSELLMFIHQVQVWWSEYVVSDELGRIMLRNCRPRFDYFGCQTVLPF